MASDCLFNSTPIRLAIRNAVLAIPTLPIHVAFENQSLAPHEDDAMWLRETLLVSFDRRVAVGLVLAGGEYRVDLFGPRYGGTERLEDLSRRIVSQITPGLKLFEVGRESLEVQSTSRKPLRPDGIWGHLPVSIVWQAMAELSAGA